jgi:hypothetical protein
MLTYRGWSVLLLTPLAAMLTAAFAFEPLLANYSSPSSCWCRWRRHCSKTPAFLGG